MELHKGDLPEEKHRVSIGLHQNKDITSVAHCTTEIVTQVRGNDLN